MGDALVSDEKERGEFYDDLYEDYYGRTKDELAEIDVFKQSAPFLLAGLAAIIFSVNVQNVYYHVSAEKLPKGPITKLSDKVNNKPSTNTNSKNTLKLDDKNSYTIDPIYSYYTKDEVYDGDYLVSEVYSGDFLQREIKPLVVGKNAPTNFTVVKDKPHAKSVFGDNAITYSSYVVHTKEHNIFNKTNAFVVADSASVVAVVGLLKGNSYLRKRKDNKINEI